MNLLNASNSCIRTNRDELQIIRCKEMLFGLGYEFSSLSRIIQLAGNEVRMKILLLVQAEGKLCVCDLSDVLEMKIPAVSQHLRKLKDAGLLVTQRKGTVIYYLVSEAHRDTVEALLNIVPAQHALKVVL